MSGRQGWIPSLAVAAFLAAGTSQAVISNMDMDSAGGRSGGGGGGSLEAGDVESVVKYLNRVARVLNPSTMAALARNAAETGPAEGATCKPVLAKARELRRLVSSYYDLLGNDPEDASAVHRKVRNDALAADLQRPERLISSLGMMLFAPARAAQTQLAAFTTCSGPMSEEAEDALTELAATDWTTIDEALDKAHWGYGLSSPYEPFVPKAGTWEGAVIYDYWSFDRSGGHSLGGDEDYRSGRLAFHAAYSPTNWLQVGVLTPFFVLMEEPDGEPERETGTGDVRLSASFWLTEPSIVERDSGFHFGAGATLRIDTGDLDEDRGEDANYVRLDLRGSYEDPTDDLMPRAHVEVGRRFAMSEDGDGAARGQEPGGWEITAGAIWNSDQWRHGDPKTGKALNFAVWADFAGTYLDQVESGGMWEARVGGAVVVVDRHGNKDPWRHTFQLEVSNHLGDEGIYSDNEFQFIYRVDR